MFKILRGAAMNHKMALIVLIMGLILAPSTALAAVITEDPTANSGTWTSGADAYSSNQLYASTGAKGVHDYYDYGISVPYCGSVSMVEVGIEYYTANNDKIGVLVSTDGGFSWSSKIYATVLGADDNVVEWLDVTSLATWTPSTLSDGSFRVRVDHDTTAGADTVYLDYVPVRVTYTGDYNCDSDYWEITLVDATNRTHVHNDPSDGFIAFYDNGLDGHYQPTDESTFNWTLVKVGFPADPPGMNVEYVHSNGSTMFIADVGDTDWYDTWPDITWDNNWVITTEEAGLDTTVYVYFTDTDDPTKKHGEPGTMRRYPDGAPGAGNATYTVHAIDGPEFPSGIAALFGSLALFYYLMRQKLGIEYFE